MSSAVAMDTSSVPFHDAVATALGFPDHYGHNLDALADCLRDVDAATVLVWTGWRTVADEHPRTFDVARRLLDDALVLELR